MRAVFAEDPSDNQFTGDGSHSGTEVAVPLVLEQTCGQRLHEREDIDANRRLDKSSFSG
jgi:hypothetical protein